MMITVKARQRLFTYQEVMHLTGICTDHLHNFAKRRRLGFIVRTIKETSGGQAEQWLFTPSDLTVLVTLFPRCAH